jgi:hypothetical protein
MLGLHWAPSSSRTGPYDKKVNNPHPGMRPRLKPRILSTDTPKIIRLRVNFCFYRANSTLNFPGDGANMPCHKSGNKTHVLTTNRRNRYPGAMEEVTPEAIVVSVTELAHKVQELAPIFRVEAKMYVPAQNIRRAFTG